MENKYLGSEFEEFLKEENIKLPDSINSHYKGAPVDPRDYITMHNLDFNSGNIIKYVTRAGKKPGESELKDLKKALDYLEYKIKRLQSEE